MCGVDDDVASILPCNLSAVVFAPIPLFSAKELLLVEELA